jgi:hypothetical protein
MHRITLNIPCDMPDAKWAIVDSIYREMPGWQGYGADGCPTWDLGHGHALSASVEPSGLCVEARGEGADITGWVTEFMERATARLGFPVRDADA